MSYFFKGSQYFRFNDVDFEVDTKAKPPFPRQTAQWWFDCQAASRKQKKKELRTRSGSLLKEESRSVFVGNGDSNDMDYMADSQRTTTSASSDARIVRVDKEDREWRMHGRPDRDEAAAFESGASGTASLSSLSCKTNPILMLSLLLISLFKHVFYG
ncbi:unnamed protein product, partial [Medioppia subpectinata]